MSFEIEGKLILKEDVNPISDSFKKREFVLEVENERNSDWNDFIKFQLTQDRCNLIDDFQLEDKLKISFNIRGRKWEKDGKVNYFSNLEAWRITKAETGIPDTEPFPEMPEAGLLPPEPDDDLPF